MGNLDGLVQEFLVESYENLDRLDKEFLQLEQNPASHEVLASIFRTLHTIKGTSGFFGFETLQIVAHAGESLLTKLRDGAVVLNEEMNSSLLRTVDAIRSILNEIEHGGKEGDGDYSALIGELKVHAASATASAGTVVSSGRESAAHVVPDLVRHAEDVHATEPSSVPRPPEGGASLADQSLRVDVRVLDHLMNIAGELVLTRNQILRHTTTAGDAQSTVMKHLDHLTTRLQEEVMKTRMQPIESVWGKLPRIVRDLSHMVGKQVRIEMIGNEIELDKSIIEAIRDPLTHMVRNAVDHAIETPDRRRVAGKTVEGRIMLRAFHEGGKIAIEIEDDGRGLDPVWIKAKAIERQLISAEHAEQMSDQEAINLIFKAGFSTVDQVTNISGRGVGMDVVRSNIDKIGGIVDLRSKVGVGTTISIKIPLTLAIIPALVVTSGGDQFAIPQINVLELVRVVRRDIETVIDDVYGAPIYRRRGQPIPLIHLDNELKLKVGESDLASTAIIIIVQADQHQFGVVVDSVLHSGDMVVKPLDIQLRSLPIFAGVTILGDGSLALILSVSGLANRANVVGKRLEVTTSAETTSVNVGESLLLFQSPDDGCMAIPLAQVVRLEVMQAAKLETVGDREVLQYRGAVLPLIRVFRVLPERRRDPRNPNAGVPPDIIPVVVHSHRDRLVGLVVGRLIDTVGPSLRTQCVATRPGIKGCVVINEKVTEILDVESVVRTVISDFYKD